MLGISSSIRRVLSIALLMIVLLTALPAPLIQAQSIPDASPSAEVPTETIPDTATALPTATSTPIAPETSAPTQTPTPTLTPVPTNTSAAPFELDTSTATFTPSPLPTATATNQFDSAALLTGVNVTVHLGDAAGPVLPNICVTLYILDWHSWESSDCTDASGTAELSVLIPSYGPRQYSVEVSNTPGYAAPQTWTVALPFGTVIDLNIWVDAQPTGTETLKAVDGVSGNPVAGACWEYHTGDNSGSLATLAIGPVCDTDNDGTVIVPDITYDAYCLFVTPPAGYSVVGNAPLCESAKVRNGTITKAMVNQSQGTGGSLHVTATSPWGTSEANICFKISAPISGNEADFSTACTDATGATTIAGLLAGTYTVTNTGIPPAFQAFADQSVTVVAGQTTELAIPLAIRSSGDLVITSVLYFGPQTLPGACYNYVLNNNGSPASTIVLGPICDTDNDGITTIPNIPAGSFCVTIASPPPGYYRERNDGYSCDPNMRGASGSIGFSPIPATATIAVSPTRTNTPRPTATQYPTPTTIPSPPPAGSEPNTGFLIKNCGFHQDGNDSWFGECIAGPSGVRFQVIQHGTVVQTFTTGANGSATITVPNRESYTLHYLNGNGTWVSGTGEETRSRYDSSDIFYFELDPAIPHIWSLTVTVKWAPDVQNDASPVGGACAKIIGDDDVTYVAERCDTDNDGTIDFGQLPARYRYIDGSFYEAVMTRAPAGLSLRTDTPIGLLGGLPTTTWTTGWTYLGNHQVVVRTEDSAGNLVSGSCYRFVYSTSPRSITNDFVLDYLGLTQSTTYSNVPVGTLVTITPRCNVAGYDLPTTAQTVALASTHQTVVTFVAHKIGTEPADQASVRISLVSAKYEFSASHIAPGYDTQRSQRTLPDSDPQSRSPIIRLCQRSKNPGDHLPQPPGWYLHHRSGDKHHRLQCQISDQHVYDQCQRSRYRKAGSLRHDLSQ